MQGRARHVLGRADPGEQREAGEAALGRGLAEEHPGRLVADHRLDAELAPLALRHLLDQLAGAVAGRGHQLDAQGDAGRVVPQAIGA